MQEEHRICEDNAENRLRPNICSITVMSCAKANRANTDLLNATEEMF